MNNVPEAPPSALPRVELMMSIFPLQSRYSSVPLKKRAGMNAKPSYILIGKTLKKKSQSFLVSLHFVH